MITFLLAKNWCPLLMNLRHLEGIEASFMINESQYLAPIVVFEKEKITSQIVYSTVQGNCRTTAACI